MNEVSNDSIIKQTFSMSKRQYLNDKESLYSNIIKLFKMFYPNIKDVEQFVTDTSINDFTKTIKEKYILFWKENIQNSSKLSFYASFKKTYELEKYLTTIKDANQKRMFTKFRISNHKLEIEIGRYQNITREERICKNCTKPVIEDEFHFAFECDNYTQLRENTPNILKEYFQMNVNIESKKKLLMDIMSPDLFSKNISKCFYVRDKSLQNNNPD